VRKIVLLWALLLLVPFTSLRMVCVELAGQRPASRASTSPPECDDLCPRDAAPQRNESSEDSPGCLLVAGGCSAVAALVVALPSPPVPLPAPAATLIRMSADRELYAGPVPALAGPPPKS